MTLGQRTAQKRKELGLSQEGLGEKLGVSRQAIYKWESDASLPEIDKLITLSKIFSVSVGWLLGVEEEPQVEAPAQTSGELTETQLQMVQEIVDRYQQAQPKAQKPVWGKWPVRILFAMCGIMLVLLLGTSRKLKEMERQYTDLAISMGEVTYSVNSQIGSITNRVESILKSQNNLMAEWSAQVASTDLRANTVTFDVRAVPRTYVEGMTALFQARSTKDTVELPVEAGSDGTFSGQITCPLSDGISLTVVLVTGDKRETQFLNDFYGLYSETFPDLRLDNWLWGDERDGVLPAQDLDHFRGITIRNNREEGDRNWTPNPPATLRVGLFQDRKLLVWYEPGTGTMYESNANNIGSRKITYPAWFRPQDVTLEPGHTYNEAAVYTDEYGRQYIYEGHSPLEYNTADQEWAPPNSYTLDYDPANWEF